jgi:cell division protein FtsB
MREMNFGGVILLASAGLIAAYAMAEWRGPHGIGRLRDRLDHIRALKAKQACLEARIAEKKANVEALESGKYLDVEIHKRGYIFPGETKYIVPEPASPAAEAPSDQTSPDHRSIQTDPCDL